MSAPFVKSLKADKMFTDKSIKHLEKIDGFDKRHGGIKVAHTMDSFNKFSNEVRPVQIVNKTKISDGIYEIMLMYGKEASNRKQEIDRQHHTIPKQRNQRPKELSPLGL